MLGLIDSEVLTNIANSIREKTGKTEQMTPTDMPTEISQIQAGGAGGGGKGYNLYYNGPYNDLVILHSNGLLEKVVYASQLTIADVSIAVIFYNNTEPSSPVPEIDQNGSFDYSWAGNMYGRADVIKPITDCVINYIEQGGGAAPNL